MGKAKKKKLLNYFDRVIAEIKGVEAWEKDYRVTDDGYRMVYKGGSYRFDECKKIGKLHYYLNGMEINSIFAGRIMAVVARKAKPVSHNRRDKLQDVQDNILKDLPQIGMKNFVVRRNVFKCRYNGHKVQNIEAAISLIKNRPVTQIIHKRVSAGYCPVCNTYFIMHSTYEKLKNIGIPCCRVIDGKTYDSGSSLGSMNLADESVLMQYGYNVNQNEDLTEKTRHKILALMIDNGILSKSEIIGYLDFFISQRQFNSKYEMAISKWEIDSDFVRDYREGEYKKYGVNAIYR